jgi:hypothetical protein
MPDETPNKARRVTIDLTPAAASEVDRLRQMTGLTTADIFRHALSLFRIYVDAAVDGKDLELADKKNDKLPKTRIVLPLQVSAHK